MDLLYRCKTDVVKMNSFFFIDVLLIRVANYFFSIQIFGNWLMLKAPGLFIIIFFFSPVGL